MSRVDPRVGWSAMAIVGIIGFLGFVEFGTASVNSDTRQAATRAGAAEVTEISFSKESNELSDGAKKEIQELITSAEKTGEIKEIRVAAWADQEYPPKGVTLAESQIELARRRAEGIRSYLEESLKIKDIRILNMAERPSALAKTFKTKNAKTKEELERSGAAPTGSDQLGLFGLKGKSSQAVLMVYHR